MKRVGFHDDLDSSISHAGVMPPPPPLLMHTHSQHLAEVKQSRGKTAWHSSGCSGPIDHPAAARIWGGTPIARWIFPILRSHPDNPFPLITRMLADTVSRRCDALIALIVLPLLASCAKFKMSSASCAGKDWDRAFIPNFVSSVYFVVTNAGSGLCAFCAFSRPILRTNRRTNLRAESLGPKNPLAGARG
jgi:hypothetical protein